MQPRRQAFDGLRKELQEFMRSSEAVLSLASMETLTDDEGEIIRYYIQWLNDKTAGMKTNSLEKTASPAVTD